jgi:nucleoside-diphosphate-sugar epimerase
MADRAALVTGYPNFVVRKLVEALAREGRQVIVLVRESFEEKARQDFKALSGVVDVIAGDVVSMDMGLSGPEVRQVRSRVSHVFHLAGYYYLSASDAEMELVNVEGTRSALAFAREIPRLERFVHYSTAFVSGSRQGVVMEDELKEPERFRNSFERTKFVAERIAREASADMPVTIVRPSLIVGDSRTGEIDRWDGPHFFMHVLVNLPINVPLPLVGSGEHPVNLVPVDYVVEAMTFLAGLDAGVGRTYHLVDANPLPASMVFELVCKAANRRPPRRSIPSNLATVLMKMPGLEKHWRSPRLFIELMNQLVIYNAINASTAMRGTGIACPPFPSYVANLVAFLKKS